MSERIKHPTDPDICIHNFTMDGDCQHCKKVEPIMSDYWHGQYNNELESLRSRINELGNQLEKSVIAFGSLDFKLIQITKERNDLKAISDTYSNEWDICSKKLLDAKIQIENLTLERDELQAKLDELGINPKAFQDECVSVIKQLQRQVYDLNLVLVDAAKWDEEFVEAYKCLDTVHDDRWCQTCENIRDGMETYWVQIVKKLKPYLPEKIT